MKHTVLNLGTDKMTWKYNILTRFSACTLSSCILRLWATQAWDESSSSSDSPSGLTWANFDSICLFSLCSINLCFTFSVWAFWERFSVVTQHKINFLKYLLYAVCKQVHLCGKSRELTSWFVNKFSHVSTTFFVNLLFNFCAIFLKCWNVFNAKWLQSKSSP